MEGLLCRLKELQIGLHPGQRGIGAWHAVDIVVVGHDREAVDEASQLLELRQGDGRFGAFPGRYWRWNR